MVTGAEWASGTIQWSNMPAASTLLASNISHNNLTGYVLSRLTAARLGEFVLRLANQIV